MAPQHIRDNAPKHATHYRDDKEPVIYLMKRGDDYYFLESGNIRKSFGGITKIFAKPLGV
ncbi:hypothetical protein [Acinetobacter variabilis]|jgi:hypothetical protein|uniref:hypothetical protein n=1 Tax=Acinetobacter variabilis TaxID=70346 RepID=UPI0030F527E9